MTALALSTWEVGTPNEGFISSNITIIRSRSSLWQDAGQGTEPCVSTRRASIMVRASLSGTIITSHIPETASAEGHTFKVERLTRQCVVRIGGSLS